MTDQPSQTPITTAFAKKVATDKTYMNRDKTTNYLDAFSSALDEMEKLERALSAARRDAEELRHWLQNNMTYYDTDKHDKPVLAAVSKRIWYHATHDQTSYPFDSVVNQAIAAKGGQ